MFLNFSSCFFIFLHVSSSFFIFLHFFIIVLNFPFVFNIFFTVLHFSSFFVIFKNTFLHCSSVFIIFLISSFLFFCLLFFIFVPTTREGAESIDGNFLIDGHRSNVKHCDVLRRWCSHRHGHGRRCAATSLLHATTVERCDAGVTPERLCWSQQW